MVAHDSLEAMEDFEIRTCLFVIPTCKAFQDPYYSPYRCVVHNSYLQRNQESSFFGKKNIGALALYVSRNSDLVYTKNIHPHKQYLSF